MAKFSQFKGSPNIFEKSSGRFISETEAKGISGIFSGQPGVLGPEVEIFKTPRPGVVNEADFAALNEVPLTPEELSGLAFGGPPAGTVPGLPGGGEEPFHLDLDLGPGSDTILKVLDLEDALTAGRTEDETAQLVEENLLQQKFLAEGIKELGLQTDEEKELEARLLGLDQGERAAKLAVLERGAITRQAAASEFEAIETGLGIEGRERILKRIEVTEKLNLLESRRVGALEAKRIEFGMTDSIFDNLLKKAQLEADKANITDNIFRSSLIVNPATGNVALEGMLKTGVQFIKDLGRKPVDKKLTVSEAAKLGVPFGTTRAEAEALNITPTSTAAAGRQILPEEQLLALEAAGVPREIALDIAAALLNRVSSGEIRQALQQDGQDPNLFNTFNRIVNISGFLASTQFKEPPKPEADSTAIDALIQKALAGE